MKRGTTPDDEPVSAIKKLKIYSQEARPPKWVAQRIPGEFNLEFVKRQQKKYFRKHCKLADAADWDGILTDHFDWWQFPIDDGSRSECNLRSEQDIDRLLSDDDWLDIFRSSMRIVSLSFGWDIVTSSFVKGREAAWHEIDYSNRDVRLYKMIRSAWLLKQDDYLESLRKFASVVDSEYQNDEGFWYGSLKLADIFNMTLPRIRY